MSIFCARTDGGDVRPAAVTRPPGGGRGGHAAQKFVSFGRRFTFQDEYAHYETKAICGAEFARPTILGAESSGKSMQSGPASV
jgi:hypothetical protein